MKKFVFSLETVYRYKQTVEKTQRADLKRAQDALRALEEERERLDAAVENNARSLERALRGRFEVTQALQQHDAYFMYLRDEQERLSIEIERAEAERDRCRDILVTTMKEVKAYRNLKEERYREYLEDVRREEAKDMGDLVTHQTVAEDGR